MDQLHQVSETFTQVKDKAVQATPSPKAAINFLKSVANSYAGKLNSQANVSFKLIDLIALTSSAVIPGGAYVVDQTVRHAIIVLSNVVLTTRLLQFQQLDQIAEKHGPELSKITR